MPSSTMAANRWQRGSVVESGVPISTPSSRMSPPFLSASTSTCALGMQRPCEVSSSTKLPVQAANGASTAPLPAHLCAMQPIFRSHLLHIFGRVHCDSNHLVHTMLVQLVGLGVGVGAQEAGSYSACRCSNAHAMPACLKAVSVAVPTACGPSTILR